MAQVLRPALGGTVAKREVLLKEKITLETVWKLGLELPGVEQATSFGASALKVNGKMFAGTPINKSAEPDSLGIRVDFDRRAELLAADPDTYYITPHYKDYPTVLVRLSRVDEDILRDLLKMAHRFVSQSAKKKRSGGG